MVGVCKFLTVFVLGSTLSLGAKFLPKSQYESTMDYIKTISAEVYYDLAKCAEAFQSPCIKAVTTFSDQGPELPAKGAQSGYLTLNMLPWEHFYPEEVKANIQYIVNLYKKVSDYYGTILPFVDRRYILELIEVLAPDLYNLFLSSDDPTGIDHFRLLSESQKGATAMVLYYPIDGLPLIAIEEDFKKLPFGQQLFIIAHELAHYALGHTELLNPINLVNESDRAMLDRTRSRVNESEADRFAILEFGAKIEDAIDTMKSIHDRASADGYVAKTSFESTHPLFDGRVKQLQDLVRELELSARRPPILVDWAKLASDYQKIA